MFHLLQDEQIAFKLTLCVLDQLLPLRKCYQLLLAILLLVLLMLLPQLSLFTSITFDVHLIQRDTQDQLEFVALE